MNLNFYVCLFVGVHIYQSTLIRILCKVIIPWLMFSNWEETLIWYNDSNVWVISALILLFTVFTIVLH